MAKYNQTAMRKVANELINCKNSNIAWENFIRVWKPYVKSLEWHYKWNSQETNALWGYLYEKLAKYKENSDIVGWLMLTIRNYFRAPQRERKYNCSIETAYGLSAEQEIFSDSKNIDISEKLKSLLGGLTNQQMNIYTQRMNGVPYGTIAKELGIKPTTARVVFYKVKEKISKIKECKEIWQNLED